MSNGQQDQPSAAPQEGPPTGGWGGEYDADATAFVQLPGPSEQLAASEAAGEGGYSPLAAPGTGAGWEPPTIPPMTPAASTDPAATGQWTLPFAPVGSQYPSAPEVSTSPSAAESAAGGAQSADGLAALGQGAAAALAGAHEARTQPEMTHGFPAEADPLDPSTPLDVAAAAVSEPAYPTPASHLPADTADHTGQHGQHGQPGLAYEAPRFEHHSGQWHLGSPTTAPAGEHTGAPPVPYEHQPPALAGERPFAAPRAQAVPAEGAYFPTPAEHAGIPNVEHGQDHSATEARTAETPPTETPPTEPSTAGTDGSVAEPTTDESAPSSEPGASEDAEHPLESYVLHVNGADRPVTDAWIGESLLYVLRERLGLAGAKDGCSQGECGACSVQVDGRLVASCLVPAATAAESEVRTVEGLARDGEPSDVQRALAERAGAHCGFCVPGMAMTVQDLLEGNHAPSDLEVRKALCGNLCRCSGYRGVLEAVREVSEGRVVAAEDAHAAQQRAAQQRQADLGPGAASAEAHIPRQAKEPVPEPREGLSQFDHIHQVTQPGQSSQSNESEGRGGAQ